MIPEWCKSKRITIEDLRTFLIDIDINATPGTKATDFIAPPSSNPQPPHFISQAPRSREEEKNSPVYNSIKEAKENGVTLRTLEVG
jgi:hypothetical protein